MSGCYGRSGTTDDDDTSADRAPYRHAIAGGTHADQRAADRDLRRDAAGRDLVAAAVRLGVPDLAQSRAPGLRLPAPDPAESDHQLQLSPGDQSRAAAGL